MRTAGETNVLHDGTTVRDGVRPAKRKLDGSSIMGHPREEDRNCEASTARCAFASRLIRVEPRRRNISIIEIALNLRSRSHYYFVKRARFSYPLSASVMDFYTNRLSPSPSIARISELSDFSSSSYSKSDVVAIIIPR